LDVENAAVEELMGKPDAPGSGAHLTMWKYPLHLGENIISIKCFGYPLAGSFTFVAGEPVIYAQVCCRAARCCHDRRSCADLARPHRASIVLLAAVHVG
jgi:hypothetical protein